MRKAESVIDDSLFTINRFLEATNEAGHNMLHAAIIHKRLKSLISYLTMEIVSMCK